jgi:hypothetical protein
MVLVLAAGVLAAPAWAGTYDVAACNAPGGRGVNNSWSWAVETLNNTTSDADRANYQLLGSCASAMGLIGRAAPAGRARFGTLAQFSFTPPANTVISKVRLWRRAYAYAPGDDPNTPENESGRWEVYAFFGGGNQIGAESCKPAVGPFPNPCQVGATPFSSRSVNEMVGRGDIFTAGIICGTPSDPIVLCRNGDGTDAWGQYEFQGAVVTIQDDTEPTFAPSGGLLSDNWRKVTEVTSYDASDNTGIRSARIALDGNTVGVDNRACDFTFKVPCGQVNAGAIRITEPVADGFHDMRLAATDAAGNETFVDRKVAIDGNAPSVSWERPRGRNIVLSVSDEASGVASGQIFVRNSGAEPFRPLPTNLAGGRLTAAVDRGTPRRVDVRANVTDIAGNTASGAPVRLSLTSVRAGGRTRRIRGNRVIVGYRRSALVRGRVTLSAGQSVRAVPIEVTATVRLAGAHAQVIGSTTTSRTGRFAFRVPAGPSRVLRFVFPGAGDALRSARGLGLRVRASSTIHASRTRLSGGGLVRFTGTIRHAGQPLPRTGLVVVLQGHVRGGWQTFADTRTDARGHWRARYRFVGRPGSYPIRVRIRRQNGFPFDLGYSRTLRVRVG